MSAIVPTRAMAFICRLLIKLKGSIISCTMTMMMTTKSNIQNATLTCTPN